MMYLRVKRKNSTIFLHVEPSENFLTIKAKVGDIFGLPPTSVALFGEGKPGESKPELMDMSSISDLEIPNDSVIYMTLKKEGSDTFEDIDVKPFDPPGDEAKA